MYIISDRSFVMRWKGWGGGVGILGGTMKKNGFKGRFRRKILGVKCFFVEGSHL